MCIYIYILYILHLLIDRCVFVCYIFGINIVQRKRSLCPNDSRSAGLTWRILVYNNRTLCRQVVGKPWRYVQGPMEYGWIVATKPTKKVIQKWNVSCDRYRRAFPKDLTIWTTFDVKCLMTHGCCLQHGAKFENRNILRILRILNIRYVFENHHLGHPFWISSAICWNGEDANVAASISRRSKSLWKRRLAHCTGAVANWWCLWI